MVAVPAFIPLSEAALSVAMPEPFVVAVPTSVPLRLKAISSPFMPNPPEEVKVADKLAEPPYVPDAGATDREVEPWLNVTVPLALLLA